MSRPISRGQHTLVNLAMAESPEAELIKEEKAELCELFKIVDRDGGGTISIDEFLELLLSMSVKPTAQQISLLFQQIDLDHSGTIELDGQPGTYCNTLIA